MLEAAFWGFVGGAALLIGAVLGLRLRTSSRTIGLVMAFGAGVLISALAFELTAESFERGGTTAVAAGLAAGPGVARRWPLRTAAIDVRPSEEPIPQP